MTSGEVQGTFRIAIADALEKQLGSANLVCVLFAQ